MNWTIWARESPMPMTANEHHVLMILASFSNAKGESWAGQEKLAHISRLSISSVRRALTNLERAGIISIDRKHRGGKVTTYTIRQPVTLTGCENHQPVTLTASTGHTDQKSNPTPIYEVGIEVGISPPPLPPNGHGGGGDFEKFWSAYPKQVFKHRAMETWIALTADDRKAALAAVASPIWRRWFEGEQHDQNGRYIPAPARWLEDRRWEDNPHPKPLPRNAVSSDWDTGAGWINDDGTAKQFWQD